MSGNRGNRALDIVTFPAEVLHRTAAPVERIDGGIRKLCRRMIETIDDAHGIGLAGPQIGKLLRLFVVRLPDEQAAIFINPTILERSKKTTVLEEGCLSIPGIFLNIERAVVVTIQAWDEHGDRFEQTVDGLLARVIQHEYDHLKGVLFWDCFSKRRRQKMIQQFERIRMQASTEATN